MVAGLEAERRRYAEEARQDADQVALLKASNQLAAWKSETLYHPENGAFTKRGETAFALPELIAGDFERVTAEIEQGLGNDQQRLAWQKLRSQEAQTIDLQVRRHVYGEMQTFRQNELEKGVANGVDEAIRNYADPRLVGQSLGKVIEQIRTNAPRLGMGTEAVDAQVRTVTSSVHVGVISQLLANEQTGKAKDYLEATRDQIEADKLDDITKALEEGAIRKQGQTLADRILTEGGTLTQQREKARAIDDPKVRDDVMSRIEHEAVVRDRTEREAERETLRSVYDILDSGRGVRAIPSTVWATMDPAERSNARSYARQLAEGVPVKTDDVTFYGLMRQAMENPEAFAKVNLLSSRSRLSSGDFQQLAGLQLSITNAARADLDQAQKAAAAAALRAAEKDVESFRTKTQLLNDSLSQYGIETRPSEQSAAERSAVAQLQRMLDRRLESLGPGAKITNTEIQDTIDSLLGQSVTTPGSWWNIFPGGRPFFDDARRLIDMTIDDVPRDQRTIIEQKLRQRGRPVTNATVLDVWLESQVR
jgi:hypothetical protein